MFAPRALVANLDRESRGKPLEPGRPKSFSHVAHGLRGSCRARLWPLHTSCPCSARHGIARSYLFRSGLAVCHDTARICCDALRCPRLLVPCALVANTSRFSAGKSLLPGRLPSPSICVSPVAAPPLARRLWSHGTACHPALLPRLSNPPGLVQRALIANRVRGCPAATPRCTAALRRPVSMLRVARGGAGRCRAQRCPLHATCDLAADHST